MEIVYAIAALGSAVAAVLAWVAKIRWSTEYRAAKEAQIALLEREVQTYKELTPMKLREYFTSVTTQMEEYNNLVGQQLNDAKAAIDPTPIYHRLKSHPVHTALR